jgi:hypothetical protein
MSRKGCSPDNAACEGFFGRLKIELFYARDWQGFTIEQFIKTVDSYIHWYNEKRIKISLGSRSPIQYRASLGLKISTRPRNPPHPPWVNIEAARTIHVSSRCNLNSRAALAVAMLMLLTRRNLTSPIGKVLHDLHSGCNVITPTGQSVLQACTTACAC